MCRSCALQHQAGELLIVRKCMAVATAATDINVMLAPGL